MEKIKIKEIKLDSIKYEKIQPKYYYTLMDNGNNSKDKDFKSKLLTSFLEQVKDIDKNKIISGNESYD
jgi:hypothetical protein